NGMFSQVRERIAPTPASPELLAALARLAEPQGEAETALPLQAEVAPAGDITDSEFEQLLDAIGERPAVAAEPAAGDEITDDEFEALLDQLHGKGRFASTGSAPVASTPVAPIAPVATGSDEITDDEFEALLDQLHGKGKFAAVEPLPAASPVGSGPAAAGD